MVTLVHYSKFTLAFALALQLLETSGLCSEVIFTPDSLQDAKRLKRMYPSSMPVFNESEVKALSKMGEPELAASRKMEVGEQDLPQDLLMIRKRLQQKQVKANVHINAIVHAQTDPGWDLNWALDNTGAPQKVALDDLATIEIAGKKGEDVGLTRLTPSSLNRLSHPKKNITVAILDTGIDWTHPALANSIALHPEECKALTDYSACLKNGKTADDKKLCSKTYITQDLDKNGYPLDCHGWSFVVPGAPELQGLGSPELADDVGHGTHVAGMVIALAPFAKVLPVKVIRSQPNAPIRPQAADPDHTESGDAAPPAPGSTEIRSPQGFTDTVARGMLYAIRSGADVVNLSLAWPEAVESELFEKMLRLAEKRGILVVAAAGNDSTESRVYPCQHSSVFCVAAHGPDGALSHFSNFGSFVDIAAPGLNIISTWPLAKRPIALTGVPGFELKNGTSMASPQVAGALASLLSLGMSADEAKARLMVSASLYRPLAPAAYPNPAHIYKWVRSGNLDIARALEQTPEPLITPAEKQILEVHFSVTKNTDTLVGSEFKITFDLINRWTSSTATEITASLHSTDLSKALSSDEAELSTQNWTENLWPSQAKRKFTTSILVRSHSVSGRLNLKLAITTQANWASAKKTLFYTIPIELTHVLNESEVGSLRKLKIVDALGSAVSFDDTWEMRSIRHTNQDYLAIRSRPTGEAQIAVLSQDPKNDFMLVQGPIDLKFQPGSELLMVDALPGETALVLKVPPSGPEAGNPSFQFHFFDSHLKPTRMLEHDNDVTVVDERFQWFKTDEGLVPAWIGFGKFPKNEKPKATRWEPKPKDPMSSRLYFLSKAGLRSATADSKTKPAQMWIQLLNQSAVTGNLHVFVGSGRDYVLTYERAEMEYDLETKSPVIKKRSMFSQPEYRNLLGLTYRDMNTSGESGTLAVGSSSRGKQRITLIPSNTLSNTLNDAILTAPSTLDTVVDTIGALYSKASNGENRITGIFSQTHYEVVYTDLIENKSSSLSLERFSFLPSFIASRSLFPISASSESQQNLPALLVPESLGSTHATEVIVAQEAMKGTANRLYRPAWLRVRPNPACEIMGNPIHAKENSELSLYCHDSFYRFPISVGERH